MKAIALISIIPLRTEPHETAEMCSQVLFAELMDVLEEQPRWARVRLLHDGYEGWVDRKMLSLIPDEAAAELLAAPKATVMMPVTMAVLSTKSPSKGDLEGLTVLLTAGTRLPNYQDGRFSLLGMEGQIDPSTVALHPEMTQENLDRILPFFLNIPYLWGGRNSMGMDCSGFTQCIFRIFSKDLPRDASQQATEGEVVSFLSEAQAGDLAFFENAEGRIIHVGILLGPDKIIHCSGRVRISAIDTNGILADDGSGYTHTLRVIKRY